MATSGTSAFNLDLIELIEEGYERAGLEMRSGLDLRTARRILNIMMIEWQNEGVNLWTTEEANFTTVQGTASYTLDTDTIDVLEHVLRINDGLSTQKDYVLDRISLTRWTAIPDKNTQGQPTQLWFDRQTTPKLVLYPVPDANSYKVVYWKARRIEDTGTDGTLNMDIPERFLPPIVDGLAMNLAMRHPERQDRIPVLTEKYMASWQRATEEDREKIAVRFRPTRYDR